MEGLNSASTLEEAYRYLDPLRPLRDEWFDAFYVPRPEGSGTERLLDELLLDDSEDDKTLFSAQQGAGESTELYRLTRELEDSHICIFFNAEEALNLGDVQYTDVLVMLGLQVYREAQAQGIRADEKEAKDLLYWYEERILEQDEKDRLRSEVSADVSLGVVRFGGRLTKDPKVREEVRAKAEATLSDLLERLNRLILSLRKRFRRRILVVVDGLDKVYEVGKASELFLYGANALLAPACRVIYTVPFPLFYSPDFQQVRMAFHRAFLLPNVKTQEQDGNPWAPGRKMLEQVFARRAANDLITPEALEKLVEASGGLLRELLRLARSAVISARRRRHNRISTEDINSALREVKNTFRRILKTEDYTQLWKVKESRHLQDLPLPVANRLLHNLSILEYNGEIRWDVHPAVRELLEEANSKRG